jgi:hypothetical protein
MSTAIEEQQEVMVRNSGIAYPVEHVHDKHPIVSQMPANAVHYFI